MSRNIRPRRPDRPDEGDPMSTDTPTPDRVTLTAEEREVLARHLYDVEGFHAADSWATETLITRGRYEALAEAVDGSRWLAGVLAAREQARAEKAEAERDEARVHAEAEAASRVHLANRVILAEAERDAAREALARVEAEVNRLKCPPGKAGYPTPALHKKACFACSRAEAIRDALALATLIDQTKETR